MKNKVLATILFSLLVVPLVQSADNSPRLVVGITVDQLRTDYLEALQHLFGEKGFKRLMREGVICENLVFDFGNGYSVYGNNSVFSWHSVGAFFQYGISAGRVYSERPV